MNGYDNTAETAPAHSAAITGQVGGRSGFTPSGGLPAAGAYGSQGAAGPETEGAALLDAVRLTLAESGQEPTPARVAAALRSQGRLLGDTAVLGVVRELRSEMVGAGLLEPLLLEPGVTDVLVNGPDEVWVDRGAGLERTGVRFRDAAAVRRLAQRLATAAGRRLDDARPWVDARLPDGTRMHAVLPPVSVGSPCVSLRVVRARAFSLEELADAGTVDAEAAALLRALVDARLSFLVSGGTGCGKTTLLSTLLGLVGHGERIVLAEDSAELRPAHPHVVRLETRPANQEGVGLVTLRDLVRQALRMRPDRLVVGEVRGPEVLDLLAALNTGHEGGCGTVHANAACDVPARLEALGSTAGLERAALHSQLASALSVVVHLARDRAGRRRLSELHVLERDAAGLVATVPAVVRSTDGRFERERGWRRFAELCGRGVR
ncbi:TadA family conjugal transfer-associated ATPase [Streptomyces sp. SL13]|jgi:pilus assembly protein CpaF|uniref:TadA family conjugal transfer-associated ATPase n=1 Tax=Streptantibioticus silvisoli TaxID=2705255 RepID=A0AA90H2Z0_9ACTN|nr:TadA family conjugal transfer-associated ATPase [Streptantibioticus silvisoli]MDI5969769.1 TadA family conjugal transfer-associated ATPase [Streptantibioticus silvisoli]